MPHAPVDRCRVLELGCGDGGNLIPMAYALKASEFTGVDLAPEPLERCRRVLEDLAVGNVQLRLADVRDLDRSLGEFDYVIAHGLYSWIPEQARDGLLRLCGAVLAANGVAFVSYNALPGRHVRQMLREMMLSRTMRAKSPGEKMAQARAFLQTLVESRMAPVAWQEMLEHEAALLLAAPEGSFWHDDLAPVNVPVSITEFAAHAARHGLAYLGDADTHLMFDPRGALEGIRGTIEREQYLDNLICRPFRMTLLCREGVSVDREGGPERMDEFLFAAPPGGLHGIQARRGHRSLEQVTAALADTYPLPASFEDLLPYARSAEELREILYALITTGFATFHVYEFPCEETVTERPKASALARYQARTSDVVTNLCHTAVKLDEKGREVIVTLDGTREVSDGELLEWFARMALLEA